MGTLCGLLRSISASHHVTSRFTRKQAGRMINTLSSPPPPSSSRKVVTVCLCTHHIMMPRMLCVSDRKRRARHTRDDELYVSLSFLSHHIHIPKGNNNSPRRKQRHDASMTRPLIVVLDGFASIDYPLFCTHTLSAVVAFSLNCHPTSHTSSRRCTHILYILYRGWFFAREKKA